MLYCGYFLSGLGGVGSAGYTELFERWLHFSALCPIFRTHGTGSDRNLYAFGAAEGVALGLLVVELARGHVERDGHVAAGRVAGLGDGLDQHLERGLVLLQVGRECLTGTTVRVRKHQEHRSASSTFCTRRRRR